MKQAVTSGFLGTLLLVGWASFAANVDFPGQIVEPEITAKERRHWAFQPLTRPEPPAVRHADSVTTPVDRFVLRKLEDAGLGLRPAADRRTLIRRVAFDLTGLPPTLEEMDRFLGDPSPGAYRDLVDRYLASPAYGERWAQHWLDLARFAETDGFEHDKVRPDAWRYRDWVIQALNDDLPYNRFVALQLAGDQLAPGSEDARLATGFLLSGPDMPDLNLQEERRHNVLNEITSTVGATLLGLGLGCAQCHDHKYDPVSQADFYRMRAFFEHTIRPERDQPLGLVIREPGSGPVPTRFMIRGDFRRPGPEVQPAFLRIMSPVAEVTAAGVDAASSLGSPRVALAEWITRPDHPLALRVIANRLWQHHFGVPLAGTPNDLGLQGEVPTHPELLDWLATELPRRGWSLKAMHRLILNSATYRQQSVGSGPAWERALAEDPHNRLLSRMRRIRLGGEVIRDAMLAVSGSLNRERGGPGVRPPLPAEVTVTLLKGQWPVSTNAADHHRRSIYLFARRNLRYPIFDVFDRPDANASCARRHESTTAPQSLTLLNSQFSLEMARRLAGSVAAQAGDLSADRISRSYQLALGRPPTAEEAGAALEFLTRQADRLQAEGREPGSLVAFIPPDGRQDPHADAAFVDFCLALFNLNEFIFVD